MKHEWNTDATRVSRVFDPWRKRGLRSNLVFLSPIFLSNISISWLQSHAPPRIGVRMQRFATLCNAFQLFIFCQSFSIDVRHRMEGTTER